MILYYVIHVQNNEKMHNTAIHYFKSSYGCHVIFLFYNKTCPYTFLFTCPKKKKVCTRNNSFLFSFTCQTAGHLPF